MKEEKLVIECECGTHLLQVINDVEVIDDNHYSHNFLFAMFSYGKYNKKPTLWYRIKGAVYYLITGNMHEDEIILSKEEAIQLRDFISEKIIVGGKKV